MCVVWKRVIAVGLMSGRHAYVNVPSFVGVLVILAVPLNLLPAGSNVRHLVVNQEPSCKTFHCDVSLCALCLLKAV